MNAKPTHTRLLELMDYNQQTGFFTWNVYRNCSARPGDQAGTVNKKGYRYINIEKCVITAHRLAWFYMMAEWPTHDIDHKNGNRDDNRAENLRVLNRAENMQNLQGAHSDNKTGFLGVVKSNDRYSAHICVDRKRKYLGTFDTPELAHGVYLQAKRAIHPAGMI